MITEIMKEDFRWPENLHEMGKYMTEELLIDLSVLEEDGKAFSNYIKELREKRNVSRHVLCEGLCNYQEIDLLEIGERVLDSRLQDALLERLGVGAENYEIYVDADEYDRWEAQQQIFNSIIYEQWDNATELLNVYQEKYGTENRFESQFILSMQGQIGKCRGASVEELRGIFEEAVGLTIPDWEEKPLCDRVLSLKELNLLLELEQVRDGGERQERYLDIMTYLEKYFDRIGMAKLYPKAVYLLCGCNKMFNDKTLLEYCYKALEYLRDTSRMYYLWEILELRNVLLEKRISKLGKNYPGKRAQLQELQLENHNWMDALGKVYDEYHVRKDTYEYTYLYVRMGMFCINDVVAVRRKMFGMTRQELMGEYRSTKTLERLEKRKTSPQRATVIELFQKLGLSVEYAKTNIVTSKPEVKIMMERLLQYVNSLEWEKAEKLLKKVKPLVDTENIYNLQTLRKIEANINWKRKKISREEYCERMRCALELTLPFGVFFKEGEKYLTNMELTCIQNLLQGMDKDSEEYLIGLKRLEEYYLPYREKGMLQAVFGMHNMVMTYVASELGNCGEYDTSEQHFEVIAEGCLRYRKMLVLPHSLYNGWWNYFERVKAGIPVDKEINRVAVLEQIIVLCRLGKQYRREHFYRKKLEEAKRLYASK